MRCGIGSSRRDSFLQSTVIVSTVTLVLFFHQGKLQVPPFRCTPGQVAPVGMTKFKAVTYLDFGEGGSTESKS
jgi:hypothetical protein